jgi:hypothetical protein
MLNAADPTTSTLAVVATSTLLRCAVGLIVGAIAIRWGLRNLTGSANVATTGAANHPMNAARSTTATTANQYVWTPAPATATASGGAPGPHRFGTPQQGFDSAPPSTAKTSSRGRGGGIRFGPLLVTVLGAASLIYGGHLTVKVAAQLLEPTHYTSLPSTIDGHRKLAASAASKQFDALLTKTPGITTATTGAYSRDGRSVSFLVVAADHPKMFWDTESFLSGYTAGLTSSGLKASAPLSVPVGSLGGKAECRSISSPKQPAATVCLWVDNSTLGLVVEPGNNMASASKRLLKARTAAEH